MDDTTSRFLGIYNEVDGWLRTLLRAPDRTGFLDLVSRASRIQPSVRRHAAFLRTMAALRNFLVHEHEHPYALAAATPHAVERFARIKSEFLSPPLLLAESNRSVVLCSPSDPIGKAAELMHDGSFSQIPVYQDGDFVGLLTAGTVARWLASNLAAGQELVEEKPVVEVLKHQEDAENHAFLNRSPTVLDGMAAFDTFLHRGKRLEAILLTESGRPTEHPLGIVTVHDIPRMWRALNE
jgi:predicted transcriptional regulator